jgi:Cys-tRNA synthase (O-phospho-L-seryl-tRNA:Cys-tRNA synthase)
MNNKEVEMLNCNHCGRPIAEVGSAVCLHCVQETIAQVKKMEEEIAKLRNQVQELRRENE